MRSAAATAIDVIGSMSEPLSVCCGALPGRVYVYCSALPEPAVMRYEQQTHRQG